jgi:inner membrane protein
VDSLTQAVLGAAVGEALLGKRLGNRALVWGAVVGTLPDLDVLLMPLLDNAADLWWHRGPSHSLLVMVLVSWWSSIWLAKRWKRDKVTRKQAGWFVFAVWSTHVLIDCFTVYGTSVWWPLPLPRVALNQLFIIDPFFTLPMLVAVLWVPWLRKKKEISKRRRINTWGLALATAYAGASLALKFHVSSQFDADLARRAVSFERRMEAPTPLNVLLWRSVVDRGSEFWVGYRSVLDRSTTPVRWTVIPKGHDQLGNDADSRGVRSLAWFSNGWYVARRHARGVWIGDVRFGENLAWGVRGSMSDWRLAFSWDVLRDPIGDPLRPWGPSRTNPGETLTRMARRIVGNQQTWDYLPPRLAGITGHVPEELATVP